MSFLETVVVIPRLQSMTPDQAAEMLLGSRNPLAVGLVQTVCQNGDDAIPWVVIETARSAGYDATAAYLAGRPDWVLAAARAVRARAGCGPGSAGVEDAGAPAPADAPGAPALSGAGPSGPPADGASGMPAAPNLPGFAPGVRWGPVLAIGAALLVALAILDD